MGPDGRHAGRLCGVRDDVDPMVWPRSTPAPSRRALAASLAAQSARPLSDVTVGARIGMARFQHLAQLDWPSQTASQCRLTPPYFIRGRADGDWARPGVRRAWRAPAGDPTVAEPHDVAGLGQLDERPGDPQVLASRPQRRSEGPSDMQRTLPESNERSRSLAERSTRVRCHTEAAVPSFGTRDGYDPRSRTRSYIARDDVCITVGTCHLWELPCGDH